MAFPTRIGGRKIDEISDLLTLTRGSAARAGRWLLNADADTYRANETDPNHPREVKAIADTALEERLLEDLRSTGIPVLSEESARPGEVGEKELQFILDPLDGTFNYVHGLGPWAVSIALWRGAEPIFGVVYSADDDAVYWGGPGIGAFRGDDPITVSDISDRSRASLCTGMPARADLEDPMFKKRFWKAALGFGKTRMLGSAAVSLARVASGAADAYCEDGIMIWDVAAGLAIVMGAGGAQTRTPVAADHSFDVFASNGHLTHPAES
jgi:myo-inositol-1(or 4)-monophosphatase